MTIGKDTFTSLKKKKSEMLGTVSTEKTFIDVRYYIFIYSCLYLDRALGHWDSELQFIWKPGQSVAKDGANESPGGRALNFLSQKGGKKTVPMSLASNFPSVLWAL